MAVGVGAFYIYSAGFHTLFPPHSDDPLGEELVIGSDYKEFFASDLQFRASFPTIPARSIETDDIEDTSVSETFYISDLGTAGTFSVSAFDWTDLVLDLKLSANELATAMVDGIAIDLGGRVESSDLAVLQGYQAVEFLVSAPESGGYVRGLIVVAPTRLYLLQVLGADDSRDAYDRFKGSFSIVPVA